MILYSQVCCQYWLTTKMKYSKYQVVSQSLLNATTKKAILEKFSMHYSKRQMQQVYSKDTDVLVLMVFAYDLNKINEKQVMKVQSRKINISKIVEYLFELTLQQSFLKFMQLQGVIQLLFYMVLGKLKFLKMSIWKRKTQASKGNWCHILKSLFKLFATPEKKKTV